MISIYEEITKNQIYDYYLCGNTVKEISRFIPEKPKIIKIPPKKSKGERNEKKLPNNITRARTSIDAYICCNPWDLFFVGTVDPKKYDRTDYGKVKTDFLKWKSNHFPQVKYIVVLEWTYSKRYKAAAWHIHALFYDLCDIKLFKDKYNDKFGFCYLDKINDKKASSAYISKQITADNIKTPINKHLFFKSNGLKKAKYIGTKKGAKPTILRGIALENEYKGNYCHVNRYAMNSVDIKELEKQITLYQ